MAPSRRLCTRLSSAPCPFCRDGPVRGNAPTSSPRPHTVLPRQPLRRRRGKENGAPVLIVFPSVMHDLCHPGTGVLHPLHAVVNRQLLHPSNVTP